MQKHDTITNSEAEVAITPDRLAEIIEQGMTKAAVIVRAAASRFKEQQAEADKRQEQVRNRIARDRTDKYCRSGQRIL